jgi:hypothetical protein
MKIKIIFFLLLVNTCIFCGQDRSVIESLLNKEIMITTTFAGESITLIKDAKEYLVVRKYFGSGVPVIGTATYRVEVVSPYMIRFSEMINSNGNVTSTNQENFTLLIDGESQIKVFLNNLLLVTDIRKH